MHKLIAKYGLAAHLAFVAVAPLFLFPYCAETTIATVLLWLSALALVWMLMEPETRGLEMPHDARRRVVHRLFNDPFFWALLTLMVFAGIRALNTGIAYSYNSEKGEWYIAKQAMDFFPGSVGSNGYMPFATIVAFFVVVLGGRHSLGRIGRVSFLLFSSTLAGIAAIIAIILINQHQSGVLEAIKFSITDCSFVGVAFGLHLLGGTATLMSAFELQWNKAMPLFIFAIGGTAVGLFVFAPAYISLSFAAAEIVLLAYSFCYAAKKLRGTGDFRFLVVFAVSIVVCGLIMYAILPLSTYSAQLDAYADFEFIDDSFKDFRALLSSISFLAWKDSPWLGTGIGSFAFDVRTFATAKDWEMLVPGIVAVPSGWWQLLVEYGIVGTVAFALPFGFLMFTYVRKLSYWIPLRVLPGPSCWIFPVALGAIIANSFFVISLLRADVILILGAYAAISANAFPKNMERS